MARSKQRGATLLAYLREDASREAVRGLLRQRGWPEEWLHDGGATEAANDLRGQPSPDFLLVEIDSVATAPGQLNALADVVSPDTAVIVAGSVNEFSFYSWLMEIGIAAYLLEPFDSDKLSETLAQKAKAGAEEITETSFIGITGVRGGVGATTMAVNLAWMAARRSSGRVALVDCDFQTGSAALMLDIEPAIGLREALEKPDRLDELYLQRVMVTLDRLGVLSSEESILEPVTTSPKAAETLLTRLEGRYDTVILDLPLPLDSFAQAVLARLDHWLVVVDPTLLALRDAVRLRDAAKTLKTVEPGFVLNKIGQVSKAEMPGREIAKALEHELFAQLPFEPLCYAAALDGEVLAERHPKSRYVSEIERIRAALLGADEGDAVQSGQGLLGRLKKGA